MLPNEWGPDKGVWNRRTVLHGIEGGLPQTDTTQVLTPCLLLIKTRRQRSVRRLAGAQGRAGPHPPSPPLHRRWRGGRGQPASPAPVSLERGLGGGSAAHQAPSARNAAPERHGLPGQRFQGRLTICVVTPQSMLIADRSRPAASTPQRATLPVCPSFSAAAPLWVSRFFDVHGTSAGLSNTPTRFRISDTGTYSDVWRPWCLRVSGAAAPRLYALPGNKPPAEGFGMAAACSWSVFQRSIQVWS